MVNTVHERNQTQDKNQQQTLGNTQSTSTEEIKHKTEDVKNKASDYVNKGKEYANETYKEAVSNAKNIGCAYVEGQKSRITHEIDTWGEAIHRFAEKFREENDNNIADVADMVADQIGSASGYLKKQRMSDLYRDVNNFAHRHPELVVGGMFVAGLTLARFVKSTHEEPDVVANSSTPPYASNPTPADVPTTESRAATEENMRNG